MPEFTFEESDQALFGVPYATRGEIAENRRQLARDVQPAPVAPVTTRARRARTPRPVERFTPEAMRQLIATNDKALERAIIVIYERQTAGERSVRQTTEHNGMGFTGVDAEFLSSLAEWITSSRRVAGQRLTDRQRAIARNKMRKYAKQLALVANEKWHAEHPVAEQPNVTQTAAEMVATTCVECGGTGRVEMQDSTGEWAEQACPVGCNV